MPTILSFAERQTDYILHYLSQDNGDWIKPENQTYVSVMIISISLLRKVGDMSFGI